MKASKFDLLNIKPEDRKVVLLQSGGLDSCYLACLLNYYGFEIHHIFIDYGQNSKDKEWDSALNIMKTYGGTIQRVTLDMPWLKESDILNGGVAVSRPDLEREMGAVKSGVYVPMRNMLFLSIASSYAEAHEIMYIATGVDGFQDRDGKPLGGTPDKHPNFVLKLEEALRESSVMHHMKHKDFEILCPIIGFEKVNTISQGLGIDCDFTNSWSCYNATDKPCLSCDTCLSRAYAFDFLGYEDPTLVKYYGHYDSLEDLIKKVTNPIDI